MKLLEGLLFFGAVLLIRRKRLIADFMMQLKMGTKIHLCEFEADSLAEGLNSLFDRMVT